MYLIIIIAIVISLFVATECINSEVVIINANDRNDTYSGEQDMYGPIFSGGSYPRPGDIPLLNRKIFRGTRVSIIEHPYVVSIRRLMTHFLTGTIIKTNIIATVAHPLIGVSNTDLGVVVGENYNDRGTSTMTVVLIIVHEDFNPNTLEADLALLKLYENLPYKVSVKPIMGLCTKSICYNMDNVMAFVTGWGRCDLTGKELCLPRSSRFYPDEMMDPMLRTVSFPLNHSEGYCDGYRQHEVNIGEGMLCTGIARVEDPVTPCLAVPGAPLVLKGLLLGFQSWGFGCGYIHDLPLVYTDIRHYHKWINYNVNYLNNNITKQNYTELFDATRASILSTWLIKTRENKPGPHDHEGLEIQPWELDKLLAYLKGHVYDFRNFESLGAYHESKQKMYELIRLVNKQNDELRKVKKLTKLFKGVPFLRYQPEYMEDTSYNNDTDYGNFEQAQVE